MRSWACGRQGVKSLWFDLLDFYLRLSRSVTHSCVVQSFPGLGTQAPCPGDIAGWSSVLSSGENRRRCTHLVGRWDGSPHSGSGETAVPSSEGYVRGNRDHERPGVVGGLQRGVARRRHRTSHFDLSFPRAKREKKVLVYSKPSVNAGFHSMGEGPGASDKKAPVWGRGTFKLLPNCIKAKKISDIPTQDGGRKLPASPGRVFWMSHAVLYCWTTFLGSRCPLESILTPPLQTMMP